MTTPIFKNFTHGVLVIVDGDAREFTVVLDKGTLKYTIARENQAGMTRGEVVQAVQGSKSPINISFESNYHSLISDDRTSADETDISIYDVLYGLYTNANSTEDCGPFQVELQLRITPNCKASVGQKDEVLKFTKFAVDSVDFQEGDNFNELSFKGKAYIFQPTFTRSAV
jgi:hypothetical protein